MAESQGPAVAAIAIAFAVMSAIVLALRMFARAYVLKRMGVDDYLIIPACCFSWAFTAVTVVAVKNGLGKHLDDADPDKLVEYSFAVWLSSMFYLACLGFVKTSVCWFYTRLGDKFLTRLSFTMFGIISCQALANVLTAAFQCQPIPRAWDQAHHPGTCVNINVFYLANAALNILTDLLTYTLPIRVIFKLQMPRKQKIVLIFILCLGLFACVSSIIRITFIPTMLTSADFTWAISGAMYWSAIEINIGILAASIPSFKAIASRFLPRLIGEYNNSPNKHRYYNWSNSNTGARHGASAFSKRGRGGDNDTVITMGGLTNIRGTSEERIIVPEGKIFATTEIETNVEISRDYEHGHSHGGKGSF